MEGLVTQQQQNALSLTVPKQEVRMGKEVQWGPDPVL